MSFAWNTPVESPSGPRPIQDYALGDPVLTASAIGSGGWAWKPSVVEFSSGTSPGSSSTMVFVRFGEEGELIVTRGQQLLMGDGKLKRADRLVPGVDLLAAADGGHLPVRSVTLGRFDGGVHQIATRVGDGWEWDGKLDGHLLNVAGVIGGDFVLEIRQRDPRMARYLADAPDAPRIGIPGGE